ncbi:hypothetical protein DUNSADRAFT_12628 [Dunaliella salina]|uniref:Encoded protein n=1 Tax=Dunaliella salina TaxID=3046 RepID=A0ABQ7GAY0_DUNSA|nr:hypothetical protein DUNSADRAFT_12628 [Dunaliella salina]|eukprot:KAF5831760.1 hypothetical protein DUNSADRAFT_12628 [Dunaliella salina]
MPLRGTPKRNIRHLEGWNTVVDVEGLKKLCKWEEVGRIRGPRLLLILNWI